VHSRAGHAASHGAPASRHNRADCASRTDRPLRVVPSSSVAVTRSAVRLAPARSGRPGVAVRRLADTSARPSTRDTRRSSRPADARPDRRALARGPSHPRGAHTHRDRPQRATRQPVDRPWQGRPASRGRHGSLGMVRLGWLDVGPHRAAAQAAVLRDRRSHAWPRVVGDQCVRNCATSRSRLGSGVASRRIHGRKAPMMHASTGLEL